jgi:hypothetical protein
MQCKREGEIVMGLELELAVAVRLNTEVSVEGQVI